MDWQARVTWQARQSDLVLALCQRFQLAESTMKALGSRFDFTLLDCIHMGVCSAIEQASAMK
jgi:hypothetical protein